jgi:hypothetical protein
MEENFYHSDFEELIKEKADQYRMYPSDKVWKGIDRSLRNRRKWYWTGFVLLLSGVSYLAITELMTPVTHNPVAKIATPAPKPQVTAEQLIPFSSDITEGNDVATSSPKETVTSDLVIEDSGDITASFEIPLNLLPGNATASPSQKAAFLISGLEPLEKFESYNIELSWPVSDTEFESPSAPAASIAKEKITLNPLAENNKDNDEPRINWFQDHVNLRKAAAKSKRISWQLAFSPTVNYRKLTGSKNARLLSRSQNVPMALRIEGDVDKLVNHKPALGFELGTHALLPLGKRVTFKGGIQFNYSKYDIRAFRTPPELATIALNSQLSGSGPSSLVSYTDLRNFGGSSVEVLKNQYYQLSVPVGFEVRVFGNEKLQFNIASTVQPTYLINRNTYLITTDYKNYTKAPSLVRRWNVNAGAEAFISYTRGDVKWQFGPQFRYQLLSSYQNEYPIKEYLMEYGIKVGITKTIR